MSLLTSEIDRVLVNYSRSLAADAVLAKPTHGFS